MNLLFALLISSVNFGYTVAIVGFAIVLFSLTLLFFIFSRLPKLVTMKFNKKRRDKTEKKSEEKEKELEMEGNVSAAISLALHLYFNELHDEESNIVTIKKVRKRYSPWNSKIYSVTQNWPRN